MSITYDAFVAACQPLVDAWSLAANCASKWTKVELLKRHGTTFLRITRHIADRAAANEDERDDDDEGEDTEALPRSATSGMAVAAVIYDIVHSPTYQVPVLHIAANCNSSAEELYNLIVSPAYRLSLQSVGTLGALTMVDHPVTGLPVWFVHPCRTAEAIGVLEGGNGAVKEIDYILRFIGLVGGGVGLAVPVEVALAMETAG